MSKTLIFGSFIDTKVPDRFDVCENSYMLIDDGIIVSITQKKPEVEADFINYEGKLILPGFVDLHVHAPQFDNAGLGYDKELLPWLETYTFPEESKFEDISYAGNVYCRFVDRLYDEGSLHSVVFGTLHRKSTQLLMEYISKKGLSAYVGKVNMDSNAPDILRESTEESINETELFLEETIWSYPKVWPIITPRFVPTCSSKLMAKLGELAKKHNVGVQSHLSENKAEIEWVSSLHPDCATYGDVYKKFGLFGQTPTIMAHCVLSPDDECESILNNGVHIAHCPTSNINLSSGLVPVASYIAKGQRIGLGSDVSGGHTLSMRHVIFQALQMSKLYTLYVDKNSPNLTIAQAFYLATRGGGVYFGNVGNFETGNSFNALVVDDEDLSINKRNLEERLQKFLFTGSSKNIVARFLDGRQI